MKRFLKLLAIVIFIIIQTEPAFSSVSKTTTFFMSVTIPEHVMTNNTAISLSSHHQNQLIQTQTVIRNNQRINLTSILVP